MPRAISSAPGKVILFGEHAVVYGVTAVAAALSDLRIVVQLDTLPDPCLEILLHDVVPAGEASEKGILVTHKELMTVIPLRTEAAATATVPSKELISRLKDVFKAYSPTAAQGLAAMCYLAANILPELMWGAGDTVPDPRRGLRIEVKSGGLPIGAGLGSSASFSVAAAGALLRLRQLMFGDLLGKSADVTLDDLNGNESSDGWCPPLHVLHMINEWAFASEVIIHGEPSGLDNTTCCFGGAVKLNRNIGRFDTLSALPPAAGILLTNTKVPRSTKELVSKVRRLYEEVPSVVKPILDSIEGITQEFLSLLASATDSSSATNAPKMKAFVDKISTLCDVNHGLLCALGVGHSSLTEVWEASHRQGMACKLTGAGGGGCAITVLPFSYNLPELSSKEEISTAEKSVEELRRELTDLGYDSFSSQLGGVGVKWHNEYPKLSFSSSSASTNNGNKSEHSKEGQSPHTSQSSSQSITAALPPTAATAAYFDAAVTVAALSVFCFTVAGSVESTTYATIAGCGIGYLCRGLNYSSLLKKIWRK